MHTNYRGLPVERWLTTIGGSVLLAHSITRWRSFGGVFLAATGGLLLRHGLTGRWLWDDLMDTQECCGLKGLTQMLVSDHPQVETRFHQHLETYGAGVNTSTIDHMAISAKPGSLRHSSDDYDMMDDSFPASDPPSWSPRPASGSLT